MEFRLLLFIHGSSITFSDPSLPMIPIRVIDLIPPVRLNCIIVHSIMNTKIQILWPVKIS